MPTWITKHTGLSVSFLKAFPIPSANDLCDALSRIAGHSGPISKVPELSNVVTDTIQAAPNCHVLKTERLMRVISHRQLQPWSWIVLMAAQKMYRQ